MIVHPRNWHSDSPLPLESGRKLSSFTLGYETYGRLNPARDNAVLVCHGLTHSCHAAGRHAPDDPRAGWWDAIIGPDKPLDTDHWFVICINCLGGCHGSTGPSSINPSSGRPFAADFPVLTIADMVLSQKRLLDDMDVTSLAGVIGGCMGGFQVLEWLTRFPGSVRNAVALSTAPKASAHTLALWEVVRQAVMSDPDWHGGAYYDAPQGNGPRRGMGLASMFGMMLWMDRQIMEEKYGRRQLNPRLGYSLAPDYQIQELFQNIGQNAGGGIDANSLIYLTKAMDYFDLTAGSPPRLEDFTDFSGRLLLLSYAGDWRYPPREMEDFKRRLTSMGVRATHRTLDSPYGHGAFHLDPGGAGQAIERFLSLEAEQKEHPKPQTRTPSSLTNV